MKKMFKKLLKPLILDENILLVGIYRVDGTPLFIEIKKRGVLNILYWLENQVKVLLYYIENNYFSNAEFRLSKYQLLLYPLSKSLVLSVLANENVSLYKLRIDIKAIKKSFEKYV